MIDTCVVLVDRITDPEDRYMIFSGFSYTPSLYRYRLKSSTKDATVIKDPIPRLAWQ